MDITQLFNSLEAVAILFAGWNMSTADWCLLAGPAIKLHNHSFDMSAWRDHLNIYVKEQALPWNTAELEQTVPPMGSEELVQLLKVSRRGIHLHLVPASRYYRAGFERKSVFLPSNHYIEAATLRGCSQMWSYKSVEVINRSDDFGEDLERIVEERVTRLRAALVAAREPDVRQRLLLLQQGYQELRNRENARAKELFQEAAGATWTGEMK